ncbi:MAG: trimethylamine methyltransferase family protein [Caldilineaceae bacterium]
MYPSLQMAPVELITKVISEAKQILAEVGIEVRSHTLRNALLERGLRCDASGERVLFPADKVEQALSSVPSSFTLYDRHGQPYTTIGGDAVHFTPASSGLKILDHKTGETRPSTTADFVDYVRLVAGLEHIAYPSTAFSTNDIEAQVSDAWRLYLVLTSTSKPIVSGAFTEHGVPRMAEMMQLFRHDKSDLIARPMAIFTITATGNFRYSEDSCQNLLDCAEWGIPMEIVPVTLMGLIAPVTQVGAAVFHTVDTLAGIVMAQLIRPGTPVLFGGAPAAFHMREATSPMLAIEALKLDLFYVQIGKALGLPTQSYMALSDSKSLDAQAGAETFGSALLATLAGVNSVSGPGMLDYVMVFSLPKLVLDNELCGQALHLARPISVVEDLPTLELVKAQLHDGHMLTTPHTLNHWPTQLHLPTAVYDRTNREKWERGGSKELWQRALEEVEARLDRYNPIETDPAVADEMLRILRSGMRTQQALPAIPPLPERTTTENIRSRRERRQRPNRNNAELAGVT